MTKEQLIELGCSEEAAENIAAAFSKLEQSYQSQIARQKLDFAVDSTLSAMGARNPKIVKSLLNLEQAAIDEDGTLTGIEEQVAAIKSSDGYLFEEKPAPAFKGYQPENSADGVPALDVNTMSYSQLSAYLGENPNFKL